MPIRQIGTPEHDHFRTIRDTLIQPALNSLGYSTTRADDVTQGGAITADVVVRIAQSDLVVADLTDLNPNVFYELGIRHALRKTGTIMLVDETRTEIPFDLAQYRTIKYTPTLEGAEHVRSKLTEFAKEIVRQSVPDNPVHTHLPELPADVVAQSSGSVEGELRAQVADLQKSLDRYQEKFGRIDESEDRIRSVLSDLESDAREGLLPSDLLSRGRSAVERRDTRAFLDIARALLDSGSARLSTMEFSELATWASSLGLQELNKAILEVAATQHPDDEAFRRIMLQSLAHSTDGQSRREARDGYSEILGLTRNEDGTWTLPDRLTQEDRATLGVMLDSFHRDGMDDDALDITTRLVQLYPECPIALRNFGRALEREGQRDEAIAVMRIALRQSSPEDDTAARWLGSTMARLGRYLDAAEAFSAGAVLDPDDGEYFLDASGQLQVFLDKSATGALPFLAEQQYQDAQRSMDSARLEGMVERLLQAAFAAPTLSSADVQQAMRQFGTGAIQSLLSQRQDSGLGLPRSERLSIAMDTYSALSSSLTTDASEIKAEFARVLEAHA